MKSFLAFSIAVVDRFKDDPLKMSLKRKKTVTKSHIAANSELKTQLHYYTVTLLHIYTNIQRQKYTATPLHSYTSTQLH